MTREERIALEAAKRYADAYRDYEVFKANHGGKLEVVKVRAAREALFAALEALS